MEKYLGTVFSGFFRCLCIVSLSIGLGGSCSKEDEVTNEVKHYTKQIEFKCKIDFSKKILYSSRCLINDHLISEFTIKLKNLTTEEVYTYKTSWGKRVDVNLEIGKYSVEMFSSEESPMYDSKCMLKAKASYYLSNCVIELQKEEETITLNPIISSALIVLYNYSEKWIRVYVDNYSKKYDFLYDEEQKSYYAFTDRLALNPDNISIFSTTLKEDGSPLSYHLRGMMTLSGYLYELYPISFSYEEYKINK